MPKRSKRVYEDDDGRTIANMNVDGMPWYARAKERPPEQSESGEPLTREEKRAMLGGVLKASMLVAGIFAVVFLVFILFCINVWFK